MQYFSIPLFFIIFRETIEAAIIVSVLISFARRLNDDGQFDSLSKKLKYAVIVGVGSGLLLTLALGAVVIYIWYRFGNNLWDKNELLWEGILGTVASAFITITAFAILKTQDLKDKLHRKLQARIDQAQQENLECEITKFKSTVYMFFWISFLSVVREGLEAVVFMGGVAVSEPASSIPIAAVCGVIIGLALGYVIHRGSAKLALKWFYIVSAYILFLMASGLLSKSVGTFEDREWTKIVPLDVDNPDAVIFDPRVNVWVFAPAYSENTGFWSIMNALFGYRKVATVGTIVSYICYWLLICVALVLHKYRLKIKRAQLFVEEERSDKDSAATIVEVRSEPKVEPYII
ncbi:high-affinity iron permease [Boothiomyces sp. JEL0866]|nr:high-affinity iron permease [Boothiomyces sp. JEL0866]